MPSPGENKDFETPVRGSEAIRVRMLGGFSVSVGSRLIGAGEWRLKKVMSLIKLLALAENHRLHREQITNLLWPDLDTKSAINNLHRALHFARAALDPTSATSRYLSLRGDLIELCPDGPLWIDVEAFESAAATARRGREPAAYRAAIDLYAGDLLPEDRYEAWAEERREALRETYLALLVEVAALYEQRKEYRPAIETLRQVVASEPAREEAHLSLMRLYAVSGQRRRAIAQYEQLEKALSEEPGVEPGTASRRLHEEILANRIPRAHSRIESRSSEAVKHNLPNPQSSFVGREWEMVEVKRSLAMTGVLTLTGTGGCGKTRLALEVARDLVGVYPDGVWLVELAPLSDPELVPRAVAATLDVSEQPGRPLTETLSNYLRSRQTLLVLDNCEHLIAGCARLADALLGSCPGLRVLATSREALGVAGEANWPLSPLTLPDAERSLPPIEELPRYEAIRLFLDRARARLPAFELTGENAGAVVEVCRKLDGIPLGIELATARLTVLAVEQVAARLNDSLQLLTTGPRTAVPRHRTLRATLAWSHDLLDEPERELFRRLSVFAGGWTLEAAEAVGVDDEIEEGRASNPRVLDLLGGLVDKSLVVAEASAEAGGALRYRMLEPVRQYGRERLEESGEIEQVRERHARHYLALAEVAEPELIGAGQVAWLERLEAEYGNLRAALDWCLDEEDAEERAETGLRLAAALGRFWGRHGPSEGLRWLEKGLARGRASPASLRAKALNEAGFIAIYQGDPQSVALLEESLALYKELGDRSGAAMAITHLGHASTHAGQRVRLAALRVEAEAMLREPLDRRTSGHLLLFLGIAAQSDRDHEQVAIRIEESLALLKEVGDLRGVAMCLTTLGMGALDRRDPGRAAEVFEEDLRVLREIKDKVGIVYGLLGMAAVNALRGRPTAAARLFGAAESLREDIGHPLMPHEEASYDYEGYLASARAGLTEAAFDAAWSEGSAMSFERAIEYALSPEEPAPRAAPTPRPAPDVLTPRQREVAALVGRGYTNRRIAQELGISEHTAIAHVRNILKKLGFSSRAQIVAWISEP